MKVFRWITFSKKGTAGCDIIRIGNPLSFFQRMRVMRGGQVIEDITGYNRVHEVISRLQPSDEQQDNLIEGFGDDFYAGADAIKIGMLHSTKVIEYVIKSLDRIKIKKIVLDPVMVAKGGAKLIDKKAIKSLKLKLICADIVQDVFFRFFCNPYP